MLNSALDALPQVPAKSKHVLLLLDEPDSAFHPEWHRVFLPKLFYFLKEKRPDNFFHAVIATHSPLLLSDLYYYAYGLKDNWMGDVSRQSIEALVKSILENTKVKTGTKNSYEGIYRSIYADYIENRFGGKWPTVPDDTDCKKNLQALISVIGEPLYRIKIMEMLEAVGEETEF